MHDVAAEVARPGDKQAELKKDAGKDSIDRLDKLRYSKGPKHTSEIRRRLQKTMQNEAAVFRTQVILH